MTTSSVILDLKSNDSTTIHINDLRAKSSLSKISMKKKNRVKKKGKEKTKSLKNLGELSLEITLLSKSNKNLEEKVLQTLSLIKHFKPISKENKLKIFEFENLCLELAKSDADIVNLKQKRLRYEELMSELCNHAKNNDDDGVFKVLNKTKNFNTGKATPKALLKIEDLITKPETTRNSLKSARNSNLLSPYNSQVKLLVSPHKKPKKTQKFENRQKTLTPSIKTIKLNEADKPEVEKKLEKLFFRLKKTLNRLAFK